MASSGRSGKSGKRPGGVGFIIVVAAALLVLYACATKLPVFPEAGSASGRMPEAADMVKEYLGTGGADGWRLSEEKKYEDGAEEMSLSGPGGDSLVVNFMPADAEKPCYERTKKYNISYRASGDISSRNEKILRGIIGYVKGIEAQQENFSGSKKWTAEAASFLAANFRWLVSIIIFFIVLLLAMDLAHLFNKPKNDSKGIAGVRMLPVPGGGKGRLYDFLFAAFMLLVFAGMYKSTLWSFCSLDDLAVLPGFAKWPVENFDLKAVYIFGDPGMPALLNRTLLLFLVKAKSFAVIRGISLVFAALAACFTYALLAKHVRKSVAWIAAIIPSMIYVNYSIQDIRGYALFMFLSSGALLLYDGIARDPKPGRYFLFDLFASCMVLSNPLTVTLLAGPAVNEVLLIREKRGAAGMARFILFAAALILPSALGLRAAVWHLTELPASGSAGALGAYAAGACVLFAAAFVFRKDFRGAIILSAACGVSATAGLMFAGVLKNIDHYFFFALPCVFVSAGIVTEAVLKSAERGGSGISGRAVRLAVSVAVIAAALFVLNRSGGDVLRESRESRAKKQFAVARDVVSSQELRDTPVVIYPYSYYLPFVFDANGWDAFDRRDRDTLDAEISHPAAGGGFVDRIGRFYSMSGKIETPAAGWLGDSFFVVAMDDADVFEKKNLPLEGYRNEKVGDSPVIYLFVRNR